MFNSYCPLRSSSPPRESEYIMYLYYPLNLYIVYKYRVEYNILRSRS